jgi:hypothetical protein
MLLDKFSPQKKDITNTNGIHTANDTDGASPDLRGEVQGAVDDRAPADVQKSDNEDLYSLKNFAI